MWLVVREGVGREVMWEGVGRTFLTFRVDNDLLCGDLVTTGFVVGWTLVLDLSFLSCARCICGGGGKGGCYWGWEDLIFEVIGSLC